MTLVNFRFNTKYFEITFYTTLFFMKHINEWLLSIWSSVCQPVGLVPLLKLKSRVVETRCRNSVTQKTGKLSCTVYNRLSVTLCFNLFSADIALGLFLYNIQTYCTMFGVTWSVLTTNCTVLLHWRRRSDW
jgi:hypothetical protein